MPRSSGRLSQPLPCKEPMIQNTMLVTDSSFSALTSATKAPKKAATAMPARITLSRLKLPRLRPSQSAPHSASKDPARAAGATSAAWLSPSSSSKRIWLPAMPPRAMAILAPQAAPAEMPRVKGSASGLRNTPCNATPATARAPPHSAERQTRARRIWFTTSICALSCGAAEKPKSTARA